MPEYKKRKNKRGDMVYGVRVFVGWDENGKKIRVNKTVQSASKKDAETIGRDLESQRDKGISDHRALRHARSVHRSRPGLPEQFEGLLMGGARSAETSRAVLRR